MQKLSERGGGADVHIAGQEVRADGSPGSNDRGGAPKALVAAVRGRLDLVVLAAIFLSTFMLPNHAPRGVYALGLASGAGLALNAAAIVLVYRTNRIINFSHIAIVSLVATSFTLMVRYAPVTRVVGVVCKGCTDRTSDGQLRLHGRVLIEFNYWFSAALCLLIGLLLAWLVYIVVNRFSAAPRLIVTVATIFMSRIIEVIGGKLYVVLAQGHPAEERVVLTPVPPPERFHLNINPVRLDAPQILVIVVAVVALLGTWAYLSRSEIGVSIRAAAENAPRAATLGVNVAAVTKRVWWLSGLLAGTGGVLIAMASGAGGADSALGVPLLVRVLTVAVFARLSDLRMVVIAAGILGMLEQAMQWSFGSIALFDGALLVVIAIALGVLRQKRSRAELEQAGTWRADREIRPIPAELRSLPTVRKYLRIGFISLALVTGGLPWLLSAEQIGGLTATLIYGIVGLSLLVLTGWAGQISLGQFGFAAIGAYVVAYLSVPFPVALAAAMLAGAAAAVALGYPALRLRGLELAIITLALSLTATSFLLNPDYLGKHLKPTLRRPGLLGIDLGNPRLFYYFCLFMTVLATFAVTGIRRSATARALIGSRDNPEAAQSFGIDLVRARLGAFAISGALAALAGALFAYNLNAARPSAFAPEQSIQLFLFSVIGGFGHVAGPLIGAAYSWILSLFAASPEVVGLATGAGGLMLLLSVGGGLSKLLFGVRDNGLRRIANRAGIVVPSLIEDGTDSRYGNVRAKIAPPERGGGGDAFIPKRYRLPDQWAVSGLQASKIGSAERTSS